MRDEEQQRRDGGGGFAWSGRAGRLARNRLLPDGRRGPMPWIIASMMFLTILAGATALSLAHALDRMHDDLAGGQTVQIIEATAAQRTDQLHKIATVLRADKTVTHIRIVPEDELRADLEPWIGSGLTDGDLPIPALIDFETIPGIEAAHLNALIGRIKNISPNAHVDSHRNYLGPVEQLMRLMMWLAGGVMALMLLVTGAIVTLAARSAYATHRTTIDVMHLLGATDIQIARLFQRRMALDALFGGIVGLTGAALLLGLLGRQMLATDSELTQMMTLPWQQAALLPLLPLAGTLLAMLTARITVRRALERSL